MRWPAISPIIGVSDRIAPRMALLTRPSSSLQSARTSATAVEKLRASLSTAAIGEVAGDEIASSTSRRPSLSARPRLGLPFPAVKARACGRFVHLTAICGHLSADGGGSWSRLDEQIGEPRLVGGGSALKVGQAIAHLRGKKVFLAAGRRWRGDERRIEMGPTSGIMAGLVVAGVGIALYRFALRKSAELRSAIEEIRSGGASGERIIELEKDPATGVYRRRG